MYERYWSLREKPFENTPDTKFLYPSAQHMEAMARLSYAVRENKGAALLTGEAGCGKTLLSHVLLKDLGRERCRAAIITNPTLNPLQLFGEIASQLGARELFKDRIGVMDAVGGTLKHNHERGRSTIIIIDEAHLIRRRDVFEELRVLLNYQLGQEFLLTLILIGQPILKERVNQLAALRQRVPIRCGIGPLPLTEVPSYVTHRITVAGRREPIFTQASLGLLSRYSEGVPQRVNNICDMCLLVGFVEKAKEIDGPTVEKTALELEEVLG